VRHRRMWWGISKIDGHGISWARCDRYVAGQGTDRTENIVRGQGSWFSKATSVPDIAILDIKEWAVLDLAREVRACVDCLLEEVLIPAHDEITVVTVTC